MRNQSWIRNPKFDMAFIIAPCLIPPLILLLIDQKISEIDTIPVWLWSILIIGVDVSHVYSTLFRTYLDPAERKNYREALILVPTFAWCASFIVYKFDSLIFWRLLAYIAAFHFIRQQYGFMMIYYRTSIKGGFSDFVNKAAIYAVTLYPLIYWHTHKRNFDWFVEGDFIRLSPIIEQFAFCVFISILAAYFVLEFIAVRKGDLNIAKNLLLISTFAAWYVGIVYFDSDIAFTATNVISHGIPYIALIWSYKNNQYSFKSSDLYSAVFSVRMLPTYITILLVFAYLEEAFWDIMIWKEKLELFPFADSLRQIDFTDYAPLIVATLVLPQLTHYILDAYIWKIGNMSKEQKTFLISNSR